MTAEVLQVEPPTRHVQRLKELLGLVTCTTTAQFRRVEGGTELRVEMDYRVAGGPIGRLFDARVGDEMVATIGGDLARLKALAEEQAGPRRADAESTRHAPTAVRPPQESRPRDREQEAPADDRADLERRRSPRRRRRLRQLHADHRHRRLRPHTRHRAVLMLRRDVGDRCEFLMVSLWNSMAAVAA
jgi:hypothetical protein